MLLLVVLLDDCVLNLLLLAVGRRKHLGVEAVDFLAENLLDLLYVLAERCLLLSILGRRD